MGIPVQVIVVYGHYQYPVGKTNALPSCDGDNCNPIFPTIADKKAIDQFLKTFQQAANKRVYVSVNLNDNYQLGCFYYCLIKPQSLSLLYSIVFKE